MSTLPVSGNKKSSKASSQYPIK